MVKDLSAFLPPTSGGGSTHGSDPGRDLLRRLGWQAFFLRQTLGADLTRTPPVRVIGIERNATRVLGAGGEARLPALPDTAIGDWFVLDRERPGQSRRLDRLSLFKRRAAGTGRAEQLIAANVDTAFLVTSCNRDFNLARLERYLALTHEAGAQPAILLTKADLADDAAEYRDRAQTIAAAVPVLVLDARSPEAAARIAPWCGAGQTVAFLGSSGVGKSTLVNALLGAEVAETGAIREDDARGRHTTTARHLHLMPAGGALIDTPGMRELQLTDVRDGLAEVFSDVEDLALGCRFRDCRHDGEPGCAVTAAVEAGTLDPGRLARWRKLVAEDRHNSATLHERKARERSFGRIVRRIVADKNRERGGD